MSRTWSKIKNRNHICKLEETLEEYSVKNYETGPYLYEHYSKKIQTDENGREYILFRNDIHFTEYFLAAETDEKGHIDRDLIFEEKRQKTLEKKLNCKFIRINTSKENYDADYEARRIQMFISKFKDKKKWKWNKSIKRWNKKVKTSINKWRCLKWIVKNILPN